MSGSGSVRRMLGRVGWEKGECGQTLVGLLGCWAAATTPPRQRVGGRQLVTVSNVQLLLLLLLLLLKDKTAAAHPTEASGGWQNTAEAMF